MTAAGGPAGRFAGGLSLPGGRDRLQFSKHAGLGRRVAPGSAGRADVAQW